MTINYEDVILPAIKKDNFIILDSSDIRALAFMFDKGKKNAINETIKQIKNGSLTCNIFPGIRIILYCSPTDILKNMQNKVKLDEGDPSCIEDINRRILSDENAIAFFQKLTHINRNTYWINLNVHHTEKSLDEYHQDMIRNYIINEIETNNELKEKILS
jgi:thymidylate kinase